MAGITPSLTLTGAFRPRQPASPVIDLFFSYAHQDEAMRDELEVHLAMLKRSGLIRTWHDRRITAGKDLDHDISVHLEAADVILLLLSPYFLASDYCYENEARRALERHADGSAVVIPVILQPCDWLASPFRRLRATPTDGKPIAKFPNIHDAFLDVVRDIRAAAEALKKADESAPPQPPASRTKSADIPHSPAAAMRSSNLRVRKTFSDRDKDAFRDETFIYIERFFEDSLSELRRRNPSVEFRFKRLSATGFTAALYSDGAKKTSCHIWLSDSRSFGLDIAYSANDSTATNSINDGLRVENDGFQLGVKASGLSFTRSAGDTVMTPHGAAEYLWSSFISSLQ